MARPDELIVGNCYFMVGFYDQDLLFPCISTLKFLRCETDASGQRLWLFNDPTEMPGDEDNPQGNEEVLGFDDEQLNRILDFAGLQRELSAVAIDHPLAPVPPPVGPLKDNLPVDLKENVGTFLSEPQFSSVTLTILYTDDGVSIGHRKEGGIELMFFAHPRRDPAEEEKIRTLFEGLGIQPHVDYLADKGRTRVLAFAAPEDPEELSELSGRVLREIYAIRNHDTLRYHFHRQADTA